MRRLLVASILIGCSYPQYGFVPDDAAIADTTASDVAADDTAIVDSGVTDSGAEDGSALDSTKLDTADTGDAGIDSAPPPLDCSAHLFCATFDGVGDVAAGWDTPYTQGGGTATRDTTLSVTAPSSLLATIPVSSAEIAGSLVKNFTAPAITSVARFEADVRLDTVKFAGTTLVLLMKLQRGGTGDGVALVSSTTGLRVLVNGTSSADWPIPKTIAPGVWFHVRIETALHTTQGSVKLFIDDMTTPIIDERLLSTATTDGTGRELLVGLYSTSSTVAYQAHYDDVTFDFLP